MRPRQFSLILGVLLSAGGISAPSAGAAELLPLEAYLDQVRQGNAALAAAQTGAEAARRSAEDRKLLTSPYAFASVSRAEDHSPQLDPLLYGESRAQNLYAVGLEGRTDFGLSARLAHQTSFTSITGADPLFLPMSDFHTSQTSLELKQDLWRNAFGGEIRAAGGALESKARSDEETLAYQARQILVQAETAYWQLALALEAVHIQQALLDRARKIEDWAASRVRLKLLDRSDLLQAQSGVQMRTLELAAAVDRERSAARSFNVVRGQNSEQVNEEPVLPAGGPEAAAELPEAAPVRLDVRAQRHAAEAAARQAALNGEGLQPGLQASLAASLNGLDPKFSQAFADAFGSRHYAYAAGLSLRVPLDQPARGRRQGGYALEAEAAARLLAGRRLEAEAQWQELRRRLRETSERLALARRLEDLQKQKADYERSRLRTGSTVTFQVLQFEQDWGQSQLARLSVEGELLALQAQVKLFQE